MRKLDWDFVVLLFFSVVAIGGLASCSEPKQSFKIGVSQCSEDIWRDKQNAELRMGAYFHENVELCFAAAYDSDERQVQQIDSLVATGIDLLIVAPNQVATISPAIDRAYDRGLPVIVFERKTNSQKYTAFMSADNYEMGRVMGEFIVSRLGGRGKVMEVMGLEGSSPAIERHNGFREAVNNSPGIELVATLQGNWTEPRAYDTVKQWLESHRDARVDLVFGMNDRTAMGARKAFLEAGRPLPLFCGIDGLPDENGGIRLVRDSLLEASYIYPTHGDQLIELAINILEGKPYDKETRLMSAIVTHDNARVLLMESEELMRQAQNVERLHLMADNYLQQLTQQRVATLLACGAAVLLLMVIVLFLLYHRGKITLRRERVVNNLWNSSVSSATLAPVVSQPVITDTAAGNKEDARLSAESAAGHEASAEEKEGGGESVASESVAPFIARFKEVVEARLSDSELSVDDLASDMHLSRVQLYRKVKSITGSSPVELLRTARLNRGYQMLLTTDKTISETAYAVGFTAPSYFTKCFKDEFGMSPSDVRN